MGRRHPLGFRRMAPRELAQVDLGRVEMQRLVAEKSLLVRIWVPAFLSTQLVALLIVGALEPAGFDRCERMPSSGAQAAQAAVALSAVVVSAGLALWRLRGRRLVLALVPTVLVGLCWYWLLTDSPNCFPP